MIKHLACQMDGNRRWAHKRGLEHVRGHDKGAEVIKPIAQLCIDKKIPYLSLYAFSIENFKRSETEKNFVFNIIARELKNSTEQFIQDGIRIRFIGDRTLFPPHLAPLCIEAEEATKKCSTLNLNFLFCYGGQQEIAHAAQTIARNVQAGLIDPDTITPELFSQFLWTKDIPYPDIVIRPGGRHRLSNFLLFQSAYSELFFLDYLWPDMTPDIIETVLHDFEQRWRNFGK